MISLTVTDIFTTEFYTIKHDIWLILHLRMLQKMNPVLNILLNPLQNIPSHASTHGYLQLMQALIIGEWAVIRSRCLNGSTVPTRPWSADLRSIHYIRKSLAWWTEDLKTVKIGGVSPYLGQYSRYKHVMCTHTRQIKISASLAYPDSRQESLVMPGIKTMGPM